MKPSVRLRLTLVYGGLFVLAGAILLGLNYVLVRHSLTRDRLGIAFRPAPGPLVVEHMPSEVPLPGVPLLGPATNHVSVEGVEGVAGGEVAQAIERFESALQAETLDRLVVQSAWALGLMALGSVGLGWVMAGRVLRPLQHITGAARRLSEENLHERIALEGPDDELKELADTFDSMLARLDAAFDAQRRFAANAAHELRTPLAIVRTEVDVALADPDASVDELRAMGAEVLRAIDRARGLLDGLLVLARSDRGIELRHPVDLAEVAAAAAGQVAGDAEAGGRTVSLDVARAPVRGDPSLLQRLGDNLLDNAVRHNEPGGWVTVRTGQTSGRSRLVVANGGPAVDPAEVETLFEPFRRGTAERTGSVAGAGLGLSIVRSVATAHGGTATATARPEGGLEVTVELPAADT
ncbi:MAG: ATP-binding protein [Actinomycetota bacterium]|nr:ATP-binding protein [Actinomycetota bacterium]